MNADAFEYHNDLHLIGDRMLQTGKDSLPDAESYELVISLLFLLNEIDSALKYLDLTLKSGYMVSTRVFTNCVTSCVNAARLDTLTSIIERCKVFLMLFSYLKSLQWLHNGWLLISNLGILRYCS